MTLRESVHVPKTQMTPEYAEALVRGLSEANVDYIEIGYISNERISDYLPAYCPESYIVRMERALAEGSNTKLAIMLHPHQFNKNMLSLLTRPSIGMVRLCVPYSKLTQSLEVIRILREFKINVCANLIRASHLSNEEILRFARIVELSGIQCIYMADSNGAMIPEKIGEIYRHLNKHTKLALGFHAHNNLHIAPANALEAIEAGATYIDASLYGFGKGMANLSLEAFVALLNRIGLLEHIDLGQILKASEEAYNNFIQAATTEMFSVKQNGILMGYYNIDFDDQKKLLGEGAQNITSISEVLGYLEKVKFSIS